MTDDPTVELPISEAHERVAQAQRRVDAWERFGWFLRIATALVVLVLLGMVAWLLFVVTDRLEDEARTNRCETQRIGEYLATFSDYLGVPPGDPFRRELDAHLRHVAEQLRNHGQVCEPIPPAPVSTTTTTTTTTVPPPSEPSPAAVPRRSQSASPEPAPAPIVQPPAETQPGKRLAKGQTK